MGVTRCYLHPAFDYFESVEHSAVEEPARLLEQWGWDVTRLPVDAKDGLIPLNFRRHCGLTLFSFSHLWSK